MAGKRTDYISWDTYFMLVALISTERSKDPRTQVGAVIVKENRILSVGYNGTSKGFSDDEIPWDSKGEEMGDIMEMKNSFVVHAEANALDMMNTKDLSGAYMYVTFSPCPLCALRISNSGIKKVIYLERFRKEKEYLLSKKILEKAGIELVQLENIELLKDGLQKINEKLEHLKQKEDQKIKKRKDVYL